MIGFKKITLLLALLAITTMFFQLPAIAQVAGERTISDTLGIYPDFTTLVRAVNAARMEDVINGRGPYTLFAPTNAAFDQFTPNTLNALLGDRQKIRDIMAYHAVPGWLKMSDLAGTGSLTTIDGRALPVSVRDGYLTVGGARVINTGIACTNGIIYPVDGVMIPPASAQAGAAALPAALPAVRPATGISPVAAPAAQHRGFNWTGLLLIFGLVLLALLVCLLLVPYIIFRFIRGLFRPRRRDVPAPPPKYTQPYQGGYAGTSKPETFEKPTIRDEGPYIGTGETSPVAGPVAGLEPITLDESGVEEVRRVEKGRLDVLHRQIIGAYGNFRDMLDLVRDAQIDLLEIGDNNAARRFMQKYGLSQFNSTTLELALEKNATIYSKDSRLMDIYRAAGAKVGDVRRLLSGA